MRHEREPMIQEVFEKIIEKLKETSIFMTTRDGYGANCVSVGTIEKIVKQEAEQYDGSELHDCKKIYYYIKTEINPYGKAFDGTAYELGLKIMDYIENMRDVNLEVQEANTKKTNADRIRYMGDEELAEIILCPYDTAGKPAHIMPCVKDGNIQEMVSPEYCKKCMMDWLQSEAEE